MAEPLIKTTGVIKEFGSEIKNRVLFGIDLEIQAGEFTSLIGASGSGKSTLKHLRAGPTYTTVIIVGTSGQVDDDELALFESDPGFYFSVAFCCPSSRFWKMY